MKGNTVINLQNKRITDRNYSLDLLRIIAMWMIVFNHILVHGGVMEQTNTAFYYILVMFWNVSIIAVNMYVLISGFFLVSQKFRPSKLLQLYFEVVFYCLLWYIYAIASGMDSFSVYNIVFKVIFPFTSSQYWFMSAYFVMYLLSPILNYVIKHMNKRQLLSVCIGLFLLFSVWVDIFPDRNSNIFNLSNGYSFHWFIVLYFFASYLRLHINANIIRFPLITAIIFCGLQTVMALVPSLFSTVVPFIVHWQGHFNRYNSVLTVLSSLALFIFFLKSEIKCNAAKRVIAIVSPLILGVYLIHVNIYGVDLIWHKILHTELIPDSFLVLPMSVVVVTILMIGCLIIDFGRQCLFSVFQKRDFYRNALKKFDCFMFSIIDRSVAFFDKYVKNRGDSKL